MILQKSHDILIDMKMPLLCVKLGGSVITDKKHEYKANLEAIRSIAKALKSVKTPLLIAHGSGSFAHTSAKKYGGGHGYNSKFGVAKVSRDAMEANRIVMDVFIDEELPAVSFRPQSLFIAEKGLLRNSFLEPIKQALKQGLIPVVYGDIIWDTKWKSTIFSGETTLSLLCKLLQKDYKIYKIIEFCDVDGVLDRNNKVIPKINKSNWKETQKYMFSNETVDATGGMKHKVETALDIAKLGVQTMIINGNKNSDVQAAIAGKNMGTIISQL